MCSIVENPLPIMRLLRLIGVRPSTTASELESRTSAANTGKYLPWIRILEDY